MSKLAETKIIIRLLRWPFLVFMFNFSLEAFFPFFFRQYHLDNLMHFLGGAAIARFGHELLTMGERKKMVSVKSFAFRLVGVVGFVMIVASFWELYEVISDHFFGYIYPPTVADAVKDLMVGMLGAVVLCLAVKLCRPPKRPKKRLSKNKKSFK